MKRSRKNYTPQEKVSILRRHLLDHVPVSDLCDELNLQPTVFYRWQKEFFENGASAFQSIRAAGPPHAAEKRITVLEEKLRRKNEVMGELMEEYIQLKKNCGEL